MRRRRRYTRMVHGANVFPTQAICLVNGCTTSVVEGIKFCEKHEPNPRPEQPMGKLMAGRA